MAGNVTGNIGGSNVLLENAATEATLQMLLQATLATTKEQKKAINDLVQKAGMDPAKVEEANQGLSSIGKAAAVTSGALAGLNVASDILTNSFNKTADVLTKFTDNQGKASDIFGEMSKLGGGIGLFATGLGAAAKFQEQQLGMYQSLTQNGINFGGSLTDMRQAASSMYLSMDEFGKLMKDHSQTFAKMGSTANQGAETFSKMSETMMKGPLGKNLQALGYTAQQVNEGLASYIEMTGGRNAEEMKDTKALTESAAAYMSELDALAEITGKSKEEQLAAAKEAAANQAWQNKMMTLSEEERKKAELARAQAFASGGKGAQEALMSAVMGFPPMTKAAREYTAIAGDMNAVTMKSAKAVTDSTKSQEDLKKINAEYGPAAIRTKNALGESANAIMAGNSAMAGTISTANATANRAIQQGADNDEKSYQQRLAIDEKQKKLAESQAATAVETQRAVQKMGQEILNALLPAFKILQPIILSFVTGLTKVLEWLNEVPGRMENLGIVVAALAGTFVLAKTYMGAKSVMNAIGGSGGAKGGIPGVPGTGGVGEGPGKAIGGVAEGLGKVGPMLSSLGKGAGGLFKGIMTGIAGGLKVFANPQVLLGAVGFGAAIAVIGAGIAAAAWIMGKALPTLAEGLLGFNDLDGKNLGEVGIGMIQLGAGLAVFGAGGAMASVGTVVGGLADSFGSFFGAKSPIEKMKEFAALGPELGLAGKSMSTFNTSLVALLTTDQDKLKNLTGNLKNLTATLKELKEASKPVEKGFLDSATEMLKATLIPEVTKAPVTAGADGKDGKNATADVKPVIPKSNDPTEILRAEMQTLNKVSMELLRAMRENVEFTKSSANSLARNGNLFRKA